MSEAERRLREALGRVARMGTLAEGAWSGRLTLAYCRPDGFSVAIPRDAGTPEFVAMACAVESAIRASQGILDEIDHLRAVLGDMCNDDDRMHAARMLGREEGLASPAAAPYVAGRFHDVVMPNLGRRCVLQLSTGERIPLVLQRVDRRPESDQIDVTGLLAGPFQTTPALARIEDQFSLITPNAGHVVGGVAGLDDMMIMGEAIPPAASASP